MSLAGKKDKWINWNDKTFLQNVISKSTSRRDVLRNIGYCPKTKSSISKLNKAIKKFDLDISTFINNSERWKALPHIITSCYSMTELLKAVGLKPIGGNGNTAKKYIKHYNLDTSHFHTNQRKNKSYPKYTYEEIFCEHSTVGRRTVKNYLINNDLIKHECSKCKNTGIWLDQKLVLQLEHINGINNDNRIKNLTFLCPNCHTQTITFAGKNNHL